MPVSMFDAPCCLKVDAVYVGPPRALITPDGHGASAWTRAMAWGGTTGYRAQAVKECLDTAAVLRSYREPGENESWIIPAESERRLLAQVNAIIALGPDALEQVLELSLDPAVPDPGRIFAALFVIGCVEGGEWLERGRNTFVAAALRNSAEASGAIEAVGLSPNPEFAVSLTPFLADERPRLRAAAIRVLGFRNALPEAAWVDALHDSDATIVAAALSAPLRSYDPVEAEGALQPLLARLDSESLMRLALRAGLSLGLDSAHASALEIARNDPSWAGAASCLAAFGYLSDTKYVREMLDGPGLPDAIRAAATLGSTLLVPDLVALLDRRDSTPEIAALVRQGLTEITGIAFSDVADASQALALWSHHEASFEPRTRYRHGRPLTLESLLRSLRVGPGLRSVRQSVYLEMLAATKSQVPHFSPYDFVRVQAESLRRIEDWLAGPGRGHKTNG